MCARRRRPDKALADDMIGLLRALPLWCQKRRASPRAPYLMLHAINHAQCYRVFCHSGRAEHITERWHALSQARHRPSWLLRHWHWLLSRLFNIFSKNAFDLRFRKSTTFIYTYSRVAVSNEREIAIRHAECHAMMSHITFSRTTRRSIANTPLLRAADALSTIWRQSFTADRSQEQHFAVSMMRCRKILHYWCAHKAAWRRNMCRRFRAYYADCRRHARRQLDAREMTKCHYRPRDTSHGAHDGRQHWCLWVSILASAYASPGIRTCTLMPMLHIARASERRWAFPRYTAGAAHCIATFLLTHDFLDRHIEIISYHASCTFHFLWHGAFSAGSSWAGILRRLPDSATMYKGQGDFHDEHIAYPTALL